MQIVQGLGPQGQLFLNQDRAIDFIAENLGIPAEILTTPQEREALIQQAQAMAQQQGVMNNEQSSTEDQAIQQ